jgi:hypothetical protein
MASENPPAPVPYENAPALRSERSKPSRMGRALEHDPENSRKFRTWPCWAFAIVR